MTILIQSLIGLFTIGPISVFLFAWYLIASGKMIHSETVRRETSLDVNGGRIRFHHGTPRILVLNVSFYNYESDVKISIGLWLFTIWIEFRVGTIFSPAQRAAFYARWGETRARSIGASCHHSHVFLGFWKRENGWHENDPIWEQFSFRLPWDREWLQTEILDHHRKPVWWETRRDRKHYQGMQILRTRQIRTVTRRYEYRHITRKGNTQNTTASVHLCRISSGWNWFRFPVNIDTYIDVEFEPPIGDRSNTTSATFPIRTGESSMVALRRMELFRKFID